MMQSQRSKQRHKFEAIGTTWVIDYFGPNLEPEIVRLTADFDQNYSRFRPDSLILKMAQTPGEYTVPSDSWPMLSLYKTVYDETGGLVTPLVGNLLADAGYDAAYSLVPKKIQKPLAWEEAIRISPGNIAVNKPVLLDFGAAGKGRLVDLVGEVLKRNGISSFCIDAGGDLLLANWNARIGLENPENSKQVIGVCGIKSGSLCGSSGNRRKWDKFHHIINPRTLKPALDVLAVWTVSKTAMLADMMATCLFFVEPAKLVNHEFDYLILFPDFSISKSSNFPAELYEAG